MKRSEINAIIESADEFIQSHGFHLPPFAYWKPMEWQKNRDKAQLIIETRLGWDITDFGSEKFAECGLFLFTLRNGSPDNWKTKTGKIYAEKTLVVEDSQITPMHFHWTKMEDIINRGGGILTMQLFNASPDMKLDTQQNVEVFKDSIHMVVPPGGTVDLEPGESITLEPYCYHQFWGKGRVLVGEVSLVNDDVRDNKFLHKVGRFPKIIEDASPMYYLVSDYDKLLEGA